MYIRLCCHLVWLKCLKSLARALYMHASLSKSMLDVLQNQLDFSISRFQNMPCCVLWRPSNLFPMLGRKGTTSGSNQYICFCMEGPILTSHSIEPAQLPWDSPVLDPSSPRSLHWQHSRTRHQLHRAWLVLLQRRCIDLPRQCVL